VKKGLRKILMSAILIAIVCPTYLVIPSSSQLQPRLLEVTTNKEIKTIEGLGKSFPTVTISKIEKWTNGTKLHMIFYHLLNPSSSSVDLDSVATSLATTEALPSKQYWDSTPPDEVIVTYTTWITEKMEKTERCTETKERGVRPLTGVYYPYTDTYDTLQFVLEGTYGDIFASYTHNDNYNSEEEGGVYPLQENKPYLLQGSSRLHKHLTKNLLDSWVAGNITAAYFVAVTYLREMALEELIELGLSYAFKSVAAFLSSPLVVGMMMLYDAAEAILAFIEAMGYLNEAAWVDNVVREDFLGDGWVWRQRFPAEMTDWNQYWLNPFYYKPMRGLYHYVKWSFYEEWGAEGIFSEKHYCSVTWRDWEEWEVAPTSATLDGAGRYIDTHFWYPPP